MANIENQLLSRIIRKGQLKEAIDWGISLDDFLTDEPRHIVAQLLTHMQMVGGQIGAEMAQQMYPFFTPCDDDFTPLQTLCQEVRKNRLRVEMRGAIQRMLESIDQDPIQAAQEGDRQLKSLLDLGYGTKQTDIRFSDALDRAIARMELLESGVDLSVARWPWDPLNRATGGVQQDDYIVYYGRPKQKKTWYLAYHAGFTFDSGKRILLYTKEMDPDNIFMRVAACIARIPYQEFRMGGLGELDKRRLYGLREMVRDLHSSQEMVCLSGRDAPGGNDTVEWLQSKIEKYDPDMTFIDGMYLMKASNATKEQKDNHRVQNISRGLRQMVLATKKPIACTLQANRAAAKNNTAELDEIAFSDAIGMDATVIMRAIAERTTPTGLLVVGGSREFSLHGFRTWAEPATNFSFKEEVTEKDITRAKANDKGESGPSADQHAKAREQRAEAERHTDAAVRRHLRLM